MFTMMQKWASNHLPVPTLWWTGSMRPRTHFKVNAMENKSNSTTIRSIWKSSQSVMSLVTPDQPLHSSQLHLTIMSGEAIFSCYVRMRDTGWQIHCNTTAFSVIWLKFRCARESSAYVRSCVMTAPALHIGQPHWALRHWRWPWVLRLEYDTRLAYLWQRRSICRHLIEVLVHQKGLSTYPYNWSITVYLPITVPIMSV